MNDANKIQKQLINTLLKHSAVSKVLSEKTKAELDAQAKKISISSNKNDDLFVLPPSQTTYESSDSETYDSASGTSDSSPTKYFNIHDVDEKSVQFQTLPADVRHEILTDLKETRKQNSWGRIHDLPKQSDSFSTYQMKRLLKRNSIQSCLEAAEKEMGGATLSLNELESLLNDHGVITENKGIRIASDENTRYLYIRDVKKTMERAKSKELEAIKEDSNNYEISANIESETINLDDTTNSTTEFPAVQNVADILPGTSEESNSHHESEFQRNLEAAIKLSLKDVDNIDRKSKENFINLEQLLVAAQDNEFQNELEEAIKLSLRDGPSTSQTADSEKSTYCSHESNNSSSGDVASTNTTPTCSQEMLAPESDFSSYLNKLRDSDFISSEEDEMNDNIILREQKATEKVFSAARSYMMEYGGLTPAGIEEIFGSNGSKINHGKMKQKSVTIGSRTIMLTPSYLGVEQSLANEGGNTVSDIITEQVGQTKELAEVELMTDSETNSDDDFIEVFSNKVDENPVINKGNLEETGIKISFNTKEELVDDIFNDIFDSNPTVLEKTQSTINTGDSCKNVDGPLDKKEFESKLSIGAAELENQKQTKESLKVHAKESTTSAIIPTLMQEIIAQKPSTSSTNEISVDDLMQLKTSLTQTSLDLKVDQGTKMRLAGNITDQMYKEAQELLSLFGIPYIVAPMEAESQCAFLNEINLTDGTITDDSDIWLFGGKTVYKNFFNHCKDVLEFKAESIQHHFKLSRHQLISLAMLVGSDYTTGIQGIGPVTALEVLAAFPAKNTFEIITTLEAFREWFTSGKKVRGHGKAFLRNKLKNIKLHKGFPSSSVCKAYLEPTVETSKEAFTWGKPHTQSLIDYAKEKFGWNSKKVTDTLEPVLRRLNDNKAQKRIQDYFKTVYKPRLNTSVDVQNKLSKRVKKALGNIGRGDFEIEGVSSSSDDVAGDHLKDSEEREAVQILKKTKKLSKQKHKDIRKEMESKLIILEKRDLETKLIIDNLEVKKPRLANLHRKEVIPQKENAKTSQLQSKMKAIEVFRKSTKGPGFVKKRTKFVRKPKNDAELSESSNSDN